MSRWLLAVSIGLVFLGSGGPGQAEPLRILVAAGNNRGMADEEQLRHAVSDAERVGRVLGAMGGVDPRYRRVLPERNAAAFADALVWAREVARHHRSEEVSLVVYYSGHGDETDLHLAGTRLAVTELQRLVQLVPAGLRLVVIDACRAGGGSRTKGIGLGPGFSISLQSPDQMRGTVMIQSASRGESSQESDQLGGAIFTHYWVSGLQGAADRDGDGMVTLDEAYAYAYYRTLSRSGASAGPLQRPSLDVALHGSGPVVLTRLDRGRVVISLPQGKDQQYLVYQQPSGSLVAEAWSEPSRQVELALPAGRFLIQRRGASGAGAAELNLPYGGRRTISAHEFRSFPLELLARKGGALRVRRHELEAGYGFLIGPLAEIGHRVRLRYGFRWSDYTFSASADLGLSDSSSEYYAISSRWVGGEATAARRFPLGPLLGSIGAGLAVRVVGEERERHDASRLAAAGYPADSTHSTATGLGPLVLVALQIPLSSRLALSVEVAGDNLFFRQGDGIAYRFNALIESGLLFEF